MPCVAARIYQNCRARISKIVERHTVLVRSYCIIYAKLFEMAEKWACNILGSPKVADWQNIFNFPTSLVHPEFKFRYITISTLMENSDSSLSSDWSKLHHRNFQSWVMSWVAGNRSPQNWPKWFLIPPGFQRSTFRFELFFLTHNSNQSVNDLYEYSNDFWHYILVIRVNSRNSRF